MKSAFWGLLPFGDGGDGGDVGDGDGDGGGGDGEVKVMVVLVVIVVIVVMVGAGAWVPAHVRGTQPKQPTVLTPQGAQPYHLDVSTLGRA